MRRLINNLPYWLCKLDRSKAKGKIQREISIMTDGRKEVLFSDVAIALDIVLLLFNQLNIPAARAQEFAITTSVLTEVKKFVDEKLQKDSSAQDPNEEALSAASNSEEANASQPSDNTEA